MGKRAVLILIMIFPLLAFAQKVEVNNRCKQAYDAVVALRFYEAKVLIDSEMRRNPQNLYPLYLKNFMDFLTLFIGEDKNLYDSLEKVKENRIALMESLNEDNPYRNYLLGTHRHEIPLLFFFGF